MDESISALKILTPIGEIPDTGSSLENFLDEIPEDAPLTQILQALNKWEKLEVIKFRSQERTEKSDDLDIDCW